MLTLPLHPNLDSQLDDTGSRKRIKPNGGVSRKRINFEGELEPLGKSLQSKKDYEDLINGHR